MGIAFWKEFAIDVVYNKTGTVLQNTHN